MALSGYNQWAEKVLAADLTVAGFRLAFTLQRLLLGYGHTEGGLGQAQIRQVSRLHGRSFDRAVNELEHAGLVEIHRAPTGGGRGKRTHYRLPIRNHRSAADVSGRETTAETTALSDTKPPLQSGDSRFIQGINGSDFEKIKDELLARGLLKDLP